jgi:hypothetical protein
MDENKGVRRTGVHAEDEMRWGPYPLVVPADYLRSDLISHKHRNFADEVKVRSCGYMLRSSVWEGGGKGWMRYLPARAIQPPLRA